MIDPHNESLRGLTLSDKYTLETRLHTSRTRSAVWKARSRNSDNLVVVKFPVIYEGIGQYSGDWLVYQAEVAALTQVRHGKSETHPTRVVRMIDHGINVGGALQPHIVLEYVPAPTLSMVTHTTEPLREETVIRTGMEICDALQEVHDTGIVHRDVKPDNVMMTLHGAKIIDLGYAGSGTDLPSGTAVGTPEYISPEQASGDNTTPATDIYSLGITLFEMLTQTTPYTRKDDEGMDGAIRLLREHIYSPFPNPRDRRQNASSGISNIIIRATQKRPEERYASVQHMRNALGDVLALRETRAYSRKDIDEALAKPPTSATQPTYTASDDVIWT